MKNTHRNTVYGYARTSTRKQKLDRQIYEINKTYPDAVIITEQYTGKTTNRPAWNKLLKQVKPGDTIVFEAASRMSRSAEEGYQLYKQLYEKGIELIFISQPYINTSVYRTAAQKHIDLVVETGNAPIDKAFNGMIDIMNTLMMELAAQQVPAAFKSAEDELTEKNRNTSQGVRRAQAAGKQIGRATGATVTTKKSIEAKEQIKKYCKDFDGSLTDKDTMQLIGIARNTYYKYKREIIEARAEG